MWDVVPAADDDDVRFVFLDHRFGVAPPIRVPALHDDHTDHPLVMALAVLVAGPFPAFLLPVRYDDHGPFLLLPRPVHADAR